jgi:hypothetical protein
MTQHGLLRRVDLHLEFLSPRQEMRTTLRICRSDGGLDNEMVLISGARSRDECSLAEERTAKRLVRALSWDRVDSKRLTKELSRTSTEEDDERKNIMAPARVVVPHG